MSKKPVGLIFIFFSLFLTCGPNVTGAPQIFGDISPEQEVRAGSAAAAEVEREYPILRDRVVTGYVERLGKRLVANSDRRGMNYRFRVIDRPDVNAFALPGGYIYVFRGLIELADNESELAGVMAHEIAHVTERHHVDQIQKSQMLGMGLGVLDLILGRQRNTAENLSALGANLAAQGAFFKFSRDAEREADQEGVRILRRSGINPAGMITLFEEMERLRSRRPSIVGDFFSSHPSASERRSNIAGMLQPGDQRLSSDSAAFSRISRRLN